MSDLLQLARLRTICANGVAKSIREANTLSLREVADEVGVSQVTIYRWETARTRPAGDEALRYLVILDGLSGVTS